MKELLRRLSLVVAASAAVFALGAPLKAAAQAPLPQNPQSGAVGLQGAITSPPPTQAATISIPRNGQTFTTLPVEVAGLCPNNTLIKIFKNNVFGGAAECKNGSYSLIIDLFNGRNDLIARVYDALDQAGPDSAMVSVNYSDAKAARGARISLTSTYAKRGANPKEDLTWPIDLTGGVGPYAVSVDWGDGKTADLMSREFPGNFTIKHQYDSPGIYNIIVKATDKNGDVAFLQLVGVANGTVSQDNKTNQGAATVVTNTKILWWPAVLILPFAMLAFWLGSRSAIAALRKRIMRGDQAFK